MFGLRSLKHTFNDETLSLLSADHRKHLEKFGAHLRKFLDGIPEMANCLAEVSQKGLLTQFLGKYRPLGDEFWESKFISNASIDDDYKDLPILMAFAHEGGNIWDLVSQKDLNGQLQINSLIERLLSMSPQQFIATSGLLAGANSAQTYVDLVGQMIDKHSSLIGSVIKNGMMEKENLGILWFSKMETVSGVFSTNDTLTFIADSRSLKAKNAGLNEFDLEDYKHLLNECGARVQMSMDNRKKTFASLFLDDAFVLLHTNEDTKAVIKNLTLKAGVWAEIMSPKGIDHERMVEQMIAAACFAHPEHFRRAGFGIGNLVSPLVNQELFADTKTLMAGPLELYSLTKTRTRIDPNFGETRLFQYARRLVPGFDLEALIAQSGFTNKIIPAVVASVGGHHPVIDEALENCKLPASQVDGMITMIIKQKAFGAYLPSTLLRILELKLHDLPYRNENGDLVPFSALENPDTTYEPLSLLNLRDIEAARDRLFLPAYAQNPGFKQAMIEYLIAQPGITTKHLTMTGIDVDENPKILLKMHLLDRGQSFHLALGV